MTSIEHKFYSNGSLRYIKFKNIHGLHRPDGPSHQQWHPNGLLASQIYHINGNRNNFFNKNTNLTTPAFQSWHDNGLIKCQEYRINDNRNNFSYIHTNQTTPAYQFWHSNGQLWIQKYYINGKLNNFFDTHTNQTIPAFQSWYDNGQLRSQRYYINDELNNFFNKNTTQTIPSVQRWDPHGQLQYQRYFINNHFISCQKFIILYHILPYHIKKYLHTIHSRNKLNAYNEHIAMQEHILRPDGPVANDLKLSFESKIKN